MTDTKEPSEIEPPSKSQRKRDLKALKSVAEALARLPAARLAAAPLSESLCEEIAEARRLSRGAYQRQIRLIVKLMQNEDTDAIQRFIESIDRTSHEAKAHFHRLESWRDRLIEEGDIALEALLAEWPSADRQHLRRLLRAADRERSGDRPPQSARALFRYLRDLFQPE